MLSCMNWMPVASKILCSGYFREGFFHHSVGARVAVHAGIAQDFAAGGKQGVIDTPGVDANPGQTAVQTGVGVSQPGFQFFPLLEEIPLELSGHFSVWIREAVFFLQRQLGAVEGGQNRPAAFRAEIECQEMFRHGFILPNPLRHAMIFPARRDFRRCGARPSHLSSFWS